MTASSLHKLSSALRQRAQVVPYRHSEQHPHGFKLRVGEQDVGTAVLKANGRAQIQGMEILPQFQGLGLGKKFYGEIKRRMPNQTLASDTGVSRDAARAWRSAADKPGQVVRERLPGEKGPQFVGSLPAEAGMTPTYDVAPFPRPPANTPEELQTLAPLRDSEKERSLYGLLSKQAAYAAGRRAAFAKFGAASSAAPADSSSVRDSGSPVATTSPKDRPSAISRAFLTNANIGQTSSFTDPGFLNSTMQGGPPTKPFKSDTTGGLRDS